jgi:N-formylmaleamate deformylase
MVKFSERTAVTIQERGGHVRANGIRQHYLVFGSATDRAPLVIVPGITSPAATWSGIGRALAVAQQVFVLDVRGRGLSEKGPHLDYGLDACSQDLIGCLEALDLGKPTIIGHSMGGRIALRASSNLAPQCRLVLVDPPLSGPGRPSRVKPVENYLDAIARAKQGSALEDLRRLSPRLSEQDLALRAEWLPTCDERAVVDAHAGFDSDDVWTHLCRLSIPTLLMVAGDHGLITPTDMAEISEAAPQIDMATIDAGHMIPMENWHGFYSALAAFLNPFP